MLVFCARIFKYKGHEVHKGGLRFSFVTFESFVFESLSVCPNWEFDHAESRFPEGKKKKCAAPYPEDFLVCKVRRTRV